MPNTKRQCPTVSLVWVWCVYHKSTGKPLVLDWRCPVFWLRKEAYRYADEHGFTRESILVERLRIPYVRA